MIEKRRYSGRSLNLLGGVALLGWAGYEFYVRLETIWWALKGVNQLCAVEHIPLARALTYFDPSMFRLVGFLLICTLLGLLVVCLRNRPTAGYLLIAWTVATGLYGWFGLHLFGLSLLNWAQSLKLIPMLLIVVGCFVNLCQYYARRHSARHGERARHDEDERARRYDDRFDDAPDDLNRSMAAEVRRRKGEHTHRAVS
ncbi:MAG: hypothetical protein RR296_06135 [Clostridia bacterium]